MFKSVALNHSHMITHCLILFEVSLHLHVVIPHNNYHHLYKRSKFDVTQQFSIAIRRADYYQILPEWSYLVDSNLSSFIQTIKIVLHISWKSGGGGGNSNGKWCERNVGGASGSGGVTEDINGVDNDDDDDDDDDNADEDDDDTDADDM